ncbi:YHS domain-containing protein [Ginsengibacter hankyongi]|uniref:YHS domain-containing protein n=1 Tax=Ginsengibacter hankyongi TaxID=2607284 RepID=A0A5J5ICC8_9BACT|nr:XdhC family protein [Ginsengibacter hankyongi]KAA9036519.1 YHS domain-containing protein [Ginsengibacter hankyongi]
MIHFFDNINKLKEKNEPFAIAIVVRREAPSSGKVGDKAVINKFGEILGWVGGGCVKGIIIKEAEDAMKRGKARLVKIGNSIVSSKQEGVMEYKMTCQSEGTVEVFVEPVLPVPHLVIIGKSSIAKALVKLAGAIGYRITAVAQDANLQTFEKVDELVTQISLANVRTTPATFIVVATQGEQDEKALVEALKKESAYVGFVASRKKMASITNYLADAGFDKTAIDLIKSPAGIDINAKSPDEVAISILAELIQVQNSSPVMISFEKFDESKAETGISPKYYINPVCGVPVDINNPKHIIEYHGEKVYFCCDGCKVKFEQDPEKYMNKAIAN